jgi:hypothetical protein
LRKGAKWEAATKFAATATRLRREGNITGHIAAGLPRRRENNKPVAAAPVGVISMVPAEVNALVVSHAVSRAFWTAQERQSGQPDPEVGLGRSSPVPDLAQWRSNLAGVRHDSAEVFGDIL